MDSKLLCEITWNSEVKKNFTSEQRTVFILLSFFNNSIEENKQIAIKFQMYKRTRRKGSTHNHMILHFTLFSVIIVEKGREQIHITSLTFVGQLQKCVKLIVVYRQNGGRKKPFEIRTVYTNLNTDQMFRLFWKCLLFQAEPNLIHFLLSFTVAAVWDSVGLYSWNQNSMEKAGGKRTHTNHTINDSCFYSSIQRSCWLIWKNSKKKKEEKKSIQKNCMANVEACACAYNLVQIQINIILCS